MGVPGFICKQWADNVDSVMTYTSVIINSSKNYIINMQSFE